MVRVKSMASVIWSIFRRGIIRWAQMMTFGGDKWQNQSYDRQFPRPTLICGS